MSTQKRKCFDILMGVGQKYYPTPKHFIKEAKKLGVCKRIPTIPKYLCFDKSRIWLVHWRTREIFAYFIPTRVEIVGDNEQLVEQAKKYGAKIKKVDAATVAAEPARGCGHRVFGGGYVVSYPNPETMKKALEDARSQGLLNDKDIFLAGPLVVLQKHRRIKYRGPFTRGYRYIKVDLQNRTYKILKIKVKKKKKKGADIRDDIRNKICSKCSEKRCSECVLYSAIVKIDNAMSTIDDAIDIIEFCLQVIEARKVRGDE